MNKPFSACLLALFLVSMVFAASGQADESFQGFLAHLRDNLSDSRSNVGPGHSASRDRLITDALAREDEAGLSDTVKASDPAKAAAKVSQPLPNQEFKADQASAISSAPPNSLVPTTEAVNVTATPSDKDAMINAAADGALQNYKSFTLVESLPPMPAEPAAVTGGSEAAMTELALSPADVMAHEPAEVKTSAPDNSQLPGHRDYSPGNPVQGPSASPARPSPLTVRLSLLDAIRYSIEGNQDIQVVSYTPKQAREEVVNAESVYDPSVFAESSYRRQPDLQSSVENIVMEDNWVVQTGIRKPLPTGGSLSTYLESRYENLVDAEFSRNYRNIFAPTLEIRQPLLKNLGSQKEKTAIKIANLQANISEEEFRQKVTEIATKVSRAYWQLYLYRALVRIDQENLDMAEEVYRREAVRLSQGLSQPLDMERARSNAQARRNTLLQSSQRLQIVKHQLKLLLNSSDLTIDSNTDVIPTEEPQLQPIELDERKIIDTALAGRPEIRKAAQEFEIRKVEEALSAHQRLPNLDVFGRYSLSGYGNDFPGAVNNTNLNRDDAWAVGLSFEIPIGNVSAEAVYRKKLLGRKQAGVQVERERDQIKLDVKQVVLAISYASGDMDSTRLAMEAAEKVVAGEFARFDIGQTTNEELLRAQDLLAGTSRNFMRAVVDYNIALAELARAQGAFPHGISIEDARR